MNATGFASPVPPWPAPVRRRASIPAAVIVAVLVLAAVVVGRWAVDEWRNRTPYPASAVAAHVSVSLVKAGQAQARLDQLAGTGRLSAPFVLEGGDHQVIIGHIGFRTPRPVSAHGGYALFVLDKWDSYRPVSRMWGIGPVGTNVGQGWDGAYEAISHKFQWLAALASPRLPDGSYGAAGMAVNFNANTRGPVTFTAQLRDPDNVTGDLARRIAVALVYYGDSGQVYWADRLFG